MSTSSSCAVGRQLSDLLEIDGRARTRSRRRAPRRDPPRSVAHSIFMNGLSRCGLWAWTARATDSRPVPRSPSTSTLQRLGAMRRTSASVSRIAGDAPNTLPAGSSIPGAGSGFAPPAVCANSRALAIAAPSSSSRTGRATRSAIPSRSASEDASGLRRSATQTIGMPARWTAGARRNFSASGRARSSTTMSAGFGLGRRGWSAPAPTRRPRSPDARGARASPSHLRARRWPRRSAGSGEGRSLHRHVSGVGARGVRLGIDRDQRPGGIGQPAIGPSVAILVERRGLRVPRAS